MSRWGDKGGSGGSCSLCRKNSFIVQTVVDPSHDVLNVCRGRKAGGLPVGIEPGIVESAVGSEFNRFLEAL